MKLPPSTRPRFNYSTPSQGLRFPRTSREAFGMQVHFEAPRNPDRPVAVACWIAAAVLVYLILSGAA